MNLGADSVVLVVGDGVSAELGEDLVSSLFSLSEHESDRVKQRHRRRVESIGTRQKSGGTKIPGEHVGPADAVERTLKCLGHRRLDKPLLKADAKLAEENLRDEARFL